MQLRTTIYKHAGIWYSSLEIVAGSVTLQEADAFRKSEPLSLDCGGEFSGVFTDELGGVVDITFSSPTKHIPFPFTIPVKEGFDERDDPQARYKAQTWAAVLVQRIEALKDATLETQSNTEGTVTVTTI